MLVDESRDPSDSGKKLKTRHVMLITLGGIIGASLFVGSGSVIRSVGPAALLSYAIGGALVVLVMRMLGEMAVARPAVGSFMEYARVGLGNWAAYLIGWLYWYFWVGVIAYEAVIGGAILHGWFPAVPEWAFSIASLLLFTATNLISLRTFGEIEFWLASIKVATIIVFLTLGALFAFGLWPGAAFSMGNVVLHGGFAPQGWWPVVSGVAIVIFSYFGTEIAVMAASESEKPREGVRHATNAVIWRIMLFYLGAVLLIVAIVPWNQLPDPKEIGPFAYVFGKIFGGLFGPSATSTAQVAMSAVILTAAFSVLNSGLYSAARMIAAIADEGLAPGILRKRAANGVPMAAVLASTIGGYVAVAANFLFSGSGIFDFIMNSAGLVALFVYVFIALTQMRMRSRMGAGEVAQLKLKMWLHPWLGILSIVIVAAIVVVMLLTPSARSQVWSTLIAVAVLVAFWPLVQAHVRKVPVPEPKPTAP